MKKKITFLFVVVMVVTLFLTACNSSTGDTPTAAPTDSSAVESAEPADQPSDNAASPEASGNDQIVIGYSVKTLSDTYMQDLAAAIEAQAAEYPNVTLEIADAQMDVNTQLNQAEDFITKGVDVLLFCPQDADACGPIIEKALAANIPVVEVCTVTNNTDYNSFVGSNDVDAGKMLGEFIMEKLPDGGKYVVLEGIMGQSSQIDRLQGLEETIMADDKYEQLAIQTGNWQRAEAMTIVEDWLTKYKELDAIICENDDMAMGALEACETAGRKDDIVILGVDGNQDNIQAVSEGRLDASILQNAAAQGRKAIDVCVEIAQGKSVDHEYMIPFELITIDNVKDYM